MKDEYIIINKTAIQKRIEELEKEYILLSNKSDRSLSDIEQEREIVGEQKALTMFLYQSTPLIPEIEKAFEQGQNSVEAVMKCEEFGDMDWYAAKKITQTKQNYIANLKLDI